MAFGSLLSSPHHDALHNTVGAVHEVVSVDLKNRSFRVKNLP